MTRRNLNEKTIGNNLIQIIDSADNIHNSSELIDKCSHCAPSHLEKLIPILQASLEEAKTREERELEAKRLEEQQKAEDEKLILQLINELPSYKDLSETHKNNVLMSLRTNDEKLKRSSRKRKPRKPKQTDTNQEHSINTANIEGN